MIRIKHSFNAGDLITIMPGLQRLYYDLDHEPIMVYQRLNFPAYYYEGQVSSTIDHEGKSVCMNKQMFNMLKPLIENQYYIKSFEVWEGQEVDLDYDLTRDIKSVPMPAGLIHSWAEAAFPQVASNLSNEWISYCPTEGYEDKIIINRTQRYNNPFITYFFLKPYEKRLIFSGTKTEYEHFCEEWELDIEHLQVKDFLELSTVLRNCKFGIYNQSMNFHIADGAKAKRILELCPQAPNTFITGANGYQFYRQAALEYYVNKLINE